ncbi:MAG: gliding motility-associated C-terminal domain-containing protein [Prevotellaceae bacterium]|jgi:gliding motility-associated-like protein|nr:gliding motility-associated C-terminal domain-containing protein [Prevotellaceae bacterium]
MKKLFLFLIFGFKLFVYVSAQTVIETGTVAKLSKTTQIGLHMDLIIDGQLLCDTSTIISIGAPDKNCRIISDNPLKFSSLKIEDGINYVDVDALQIDGDIIFNKGKIHLPTTELKGSILNENETGYIAGGVIRKELKNISSGQKTTTGLGVSITPTRNHETATIIRAHEKQNNRGEWSIAKYYDFPSTIEVSAVDFSYLNAQSDKKTDTYLLYYKSPHDTWQSINSQTNHETKRVTSKQDSPVLIQHITLFPFPELNYSHYITPNDDGFNDYFEIIGIEKCPNSKLVILTPTGTIIYTGEPYNNDFDGKNLDMSAGAYYYIFWCDKNESPVKKGYLEIIK